MAGRDPVGMKGFYRPFFVLLRLQHLGKLMDLKHFKFLKHTPVNRRFLFQRFGISA